MSACRRAAGMLSAISTSSFGRGRDAAMAKLMLEWRDRDFAAGCGSCRRRRSWMRDLEKLLSVDHDGLVVVAGGFVTARPPWTPKVYPTRRKRGGSLGHQPIHALAPFCRFLESRWHRASQCRNVFFCQRWKVDSLVFHPSVELDTANGTIGYMPGQHTSLTSTNA